MARLHIFLALSLIIFIQASSSSIPSTNSTSLKGGRSKPRRSRNNNPNNGHNKGSNGDSNTDEDDQTNYASNCTFKVAIKTSCSSPSYTRDQIGLAFGDAKGNQVYVPRMEKQCVCPFEACYTDIIPVTGPCAYDVCYLYLYRRGNDGWNVQDVRISSPSIQTVTYTYDSWILEDTWFGFDSCQVSSSQGYNKPRISTLIMMTIVALMFSVLECYLV